MSLVLRLMRGSALKVLSVIIAVVLWFQVHGRGEGSLSMDVPLQVQGLPQQMVIVNDLPDQVRVTVSGLQARLNGLEPHDIHVPLDASGITGPGVVERAVRPGDVRLPAGLDVEKLQPDRLELQVDRIVRRHIRVRPRLELEEGWRIEEVAVSPARVEVSGPEIWLDGLGAVETAAIRPPARPGAFEARVGIQTPSGKAIRLVDAKARFVVRGVLRRAEGGDREQNQGG